jgi:glucose-1-phosphate cytidylyltransferase
MPILWHIMKIYDRFDFKDFYLTLGYKGDVIKEYFLNYKTKSSDFRVDLLNGNIEILAPHNENWSITMVDTGSKTMTGGRLLRMKKLIQSDELFFVTYGDGLANIHLENLLKFHREHGKIATVTAVRPAARFGNLEIEHDGRVGSFIEKLQTSEGWINGGFFVFNSKIFDYLENDSTILEQEPLQSLARDSELMAYHHDGFWQCMDTVRDRDLLRAKFDSGTPPWENV